MRQGTSIPATLTTSHYNDWPNTAGFESVYEELEPVELSIEGHIPAYAAGTFFCTAAGPRTLRDENGDMIYKINHLFDEFSQVHRFQLHAPANTSDSDARIDKITYNSRLTSDKLIANIRKTGKLSEEFTFASTYDPCKSFFQKFQAFFVPPRLGEPNEVNNAVTISVNYPGLSPSGQQHGSPHPSNKIVTLCNKTDINRFQFLDPETLQPTGLSTQIQLHPDLKGPMSAAHPGTDPDTGELFNFNLDFTGLNATWRIFRTTPSTTKTTVLASIYHPAAYLHSTFLTKNFVILCIWNSHFTKAGVSILWNKNVLDSMYFNDTTPAKWFVVDRRCPQTEGGKGLVATFESDPFFAFHTINAHEVPHVEKTTNSNDETNKVDILCDVVTYRNIDMLHEFYMDKLISSHPEAHKTCANLASGRYEQIAARLRRYRLSSIPLPSSSSISSSERRKATIEFTAPVTSTGELPTLNMTRLTKPYRYIYGVHGPSGHKSTFVDGLVKFDIQTQKAIYWERTGHTAGEAIFVPDPKGKEEDDGVLIVVVLDGYREKSYLMVLDARDLKEVGRAETRGVVGFGFHGLHVGV